MKPLPSLAISLPEAPAQVQVKTLAPQEAERWDAFVATCPQATFFHLAGWQRVMERTFGHPTYYFYAQRNGTLEGILPLGHIRSWWFGNALISAPFCVYGGIAATSRPAREALEKAARELAARLQVDYLELRYREAQSTDPPAKDLYVTFRKEIDPDPQVNLQAIPRKQRAMVRKGIEAGLRGEVDAELDRFYALYAESQRNLGTPVPPYRWFQQIKEVFGDACEVLTITRGGKPISSVLSYYFRDEVLPYYAGGGTAARECKANDFMYWDLMQRACERGFRVFDFGRSKKDTGSFHFKKNWGFTPASLHYEYHLVRAPEIPNINPLNPKYQRFVKLWRRLPVAVANRVGPLISRYLA